MSSYEELLRIGKGSQRRKDSQLQNIKDRQQLAEVSKRGRLLAESLAKAWAKKKQNKSNLLENVTRLAEESGRLNKVLKKEALVGRGDGVDRIKKNYNKLGNAGEIVRVSHSGTRSRKEETKGIGTKSKTITKLGSRHKVDVSKSNSSSTYRHTQRSLKGSSSSSGISGGNKVGRSTTTPSALKYEDVMKLANKNNRNTEAAKQQELDKSNPSKLAAIPKVRVRTRTSSSICHKKDFGHKSVSLPPLPISKARLHSNKASHKSTISKSDVRNGSVSGGVDSTQEIIALKRRLAEQDVEIKKLKSVSGNSSSSSSSSKNKSHRRQGLVGGKQAKDKQDVAKIRRLNRKKQMLAELEAKDKERKRKHKLKLIEAKKRHGGRNVNSSKVRRSTRSDSLDSDLDDFIVDDEDADSDNDNNLYSEGNKTAFDMLREISGYDPLKYRGQFEDTRNMESSFRHQTIEERKSMKIARDDDRREALKELKRLEKEGSSDEYDSDEYE